MVYDPPEKILGQRKETSIQCPSQPMGHDAGPTFLPSTHQPTPHPMDPYKLKGAGLEIATSIAGSIPFSVE